MIGLDPVAEAILAEEGAVGPNALDTAKRFPAQFHALATFGAMVFLDHRADVVGDLDGCWIEQLAQDLGLLERRQVLEPCGQECRCAEACDFPTECLIESAGVTAAAHELTEEIH